RRDWLRLSAAGVVGYSLSGWLPVLAADTAKHPQRRRACILLWMDGGPSQMDTFDLKPGHAHGGPYKEIATAVPGIKISEHLPKIARHMDRMVLIRSMTTKEGDHGRAQHYLRTGYQPQGDILYPPIGALLSKELGQADAAMPCFVSIAPDQAVSPSAHGPGFLGPEFAPLVVGESGRAVAGAGANLYERALQVENLEAPADVPAAHLASRIGLLGELENDFLKERPGTPARSHQAAYHRAVKLMRSAGGRVFNLDEEKDSLRDAYGRNLFGQGCLLARRLVERGVPFIEVTLGGLNGGALGWDTHAQNFETVKNLSQVLDAAWATLLQDLKDRGLLGSTLVVWMGEFGRTPQINGTRGRDHFPNAWSTVLAGGGIKGGQVIGRTSPDGMTIKERPVRVPDFLATVCQALGVDPKKQNLSNVGRPIRIADKSAQVIKEALA
ncbi:MAG TPA: DUF1501 domain-containing protein, partial [Gemmataceae bacterium]|nr:DUF1501 domain-containing protein [Gemmataceae bacterium]